MVHRDARVRAEMRLGLSSAPATALAQLKYWQQAREAKAAPELVVDLSTVALPKFYEEMNGHWGVHLRYATNLLELACSAAI